MDIAAIRKKAKSKSLPSGAQQEGVVNKQTGVSPAKQNEVQVDPAAVGEIHVPPAHEERALVLPEALSETERLDRLFAPPEEFISTDESYKESLGCQTEALSQVSHQYLSFHLGREEYALDIRRISEIIKVRELTEVPRAPGFILGIISLRGVVVPVFDLCRRLNLGSCERLPTTRVVVCQLEDIAVGLQVDSINQVIDLIDEEIEPPPGVLSGLDREMVSGIGRYQGRMIILLNLRSVLDAEALS